MLRVSDSGIDALRFDYELFTLIEPYIDVSEEATKHVSSSVNNFTFKGSDNVLTFLGPDL